MRSEEYRDNFLSCRLLSADFLLFAVRTWRLQRHRGGEWLKLLHCEGGMWVMCTGNYCTGQEAWPAPVSFWHKGWTRGCVPYINFPIHRVALLKLLLNCLENVRAWVLFYLEKHPTMTPVIHYTNQLSGAVLLPLCRRKVRAAFKTTVHAELKQRKCDFSILPVKLLPEKYTISWEISSPCLSQPLKTVNCHIIIKLHV